MSDAERDPHVLVSARIGASQKLIGLPSNRARWGWIVMLGQAKLQRPPGRFASLAQARFLAGEFRDCVTPWLDAGLLHAAVAARECPRCAVAFLELADAEIVVHDWRAHQERSRTTVWRDEKGVPNGHGNLTPGNDGETSGETVGKQSGNLTPRAPTRALQSQSLSQSENGGGGPGEPDAWTAFERRTGEIPGPKMRSWLDELCEAHGEARVTATLAALPKTQRTSVDYLKAVRDALRAEDFEAEKAERTAEKAAVKAKRAPLTVVRAPDDVSPEEARRLAAEYHAASRAEA